jgi:hypothetical protein
MEGFSFGVARTSGARDLDPTCQPVQIAELAKQEKCNDRSYRWSSASRRIGVECYIKRKIEPDWADAFYDAIGVPKDPIPLRLEVAVAQILRHHVQGSLPQWSAAIGEEVFLNRKVHKRHPNARLVFNLKLVCTIKLGEYPIGVKCFSTASRLAIALVSSIGIQDRCTVLSRVALAFDVARCGS